MPRLDAPGHPPRHEGATHNAADSEQKKPEELRRRQVQNLAQIGGRREHIQEHAVEGHAAGQHQHQQTRVAQQLGIAPHQMAGAEGLARRDVQRLGQPTPSGRTEQGAQRRQQPEDGVPVAIHEDQPADQRCHGRRDAEEDRHLRHHALGIGQRKQVADDGARNHHTGARADTLQGAKEHQLTDRLRQRAAHRGQREQRDAGQQYRAAPEAVGQRAMEEVHDREAEQVARQRLLHLHRRGADGRGDARKRWQVGVDRERTDHAHAGQQQSQRPARAAPEGCRVGIHGVGAV